ncbi:hypothetical protein EDD18DRAFT_1353428 [Armillaria luteobubalina]|uniref:DUF5648 domain-containing protein n=1 Tax=Armillaria luteobubalina TaxID=153913 RepID=A0AA39TND6_9AGAR|nr:hypothetical protein EDD18DRAFT_1353428 [Armillaria luteobubalina]
MAASVNVTQEARAAEACPDPSTGIPLLRARYEVSGTRFYTTNAAWMAQIAASDWVPEGTAGLVFPSPALSTVPMYAFYQSGPPLDWYYTTSASDKATWDKNTKYADQGIFAYMFSNTGCGGVPFYTLWDPVHQVHLFTADQDERKRATSMSGGYIEVGIAGYILPL